MNNALLSAGLALGRASSSSTTLRRPSGGRGHHHGGNDDGGGSSTVLYIDKASGRGRSRPGVSSAFRQWTRSATPDVQEAIVKLFRPKRPKE
jgi:hypothetical protein